MHSFPLHDILIISLCKDSVYTFSFLIFFADSPKSMQRVPLSVYGETLVISPSIIGYFVVYPTILRRLSLDTFATGFSGWPVCIALNQIRIISVGASRFFRSYFLFYLFIPNAKASCCRTLFYRVLAILTVQTLWYKKRMHRFDTSPFWFLVLKDFLRELKLHSLKYRFNKAH